MRTAVTNSLIAIVCSLHAADASHAGMIVVDNLGQVAPSGGGISNGIASATQFTVGSGLWSIDSVTLRITELTGNNPDQIVLRILGDVAGIPGSTVFGSLESTSNITVTGNYTFTPLAPITLAGGASYWLAGFATSTNASYPWWVTTSETDNGVLGWSIGTDRYQSPGVIAGPWTPVDDRSGMFRIEATQTVPEPASVAMLSLGLLAVSAAARRRRSPSA